MGVLGPFKDFNLTHYNELLLATVQELANKLSFGISNSVDVSRDYKVNVAVRKSVGKKYEEVRAILSADFNKKWGSKKVSGLNIHDENQNVFFTFHLDINSFHKTTFALVQFYSDVTFYFIV